MNTDKAAQLKFLRTLVRYFYDDEAIIVMDYLLTQKSFFQSEGLPEPQIIKDLKFDKDTIKNTLGIFRKAGILAAEDRKPEGEKTHKKISFWGLNNKLRENLLTLLSRYKEVIERRKEEIRFIKFACPTCKREKTETQFLSDPLCFYCNRTPLVEKKIPNSNFTLEDVDNAKKIIEALSHEIKAYDDNDNDGDGEADPKFARRFRVSSDLQLQLSHDFFKGFEMYLKGLYDSRKDFKDSILKRDTMTTLPDRGADKEETSKRILEHLQKSATHVDDPLVDVETSNIGVMKQVLDKRKRNTVKDDESYDREFKEHQRKKYTFL